MKSAQGGCSQAVKNIWGWCETYYPGPAGYLISKDEMAKKFGRVRLDPMIRTCEPLRKKAFLKHGSGTTMQEKVFTDGYLSIFGGRSVLNLQSIPYRHMFIDEVDSLLEALEGSDPIELARKRTNSYVGETLIVAFGHPSRSRGASSGCGGYPARSRGRSREAVTGGRPNGSSTAVIGTSAKCAGTGSIR
jgi:phage terminase large subunit GpA-like protein